MILGWATGGIIFGMMSDELGRVKTMVVTLMIYSGFTGLSGLAQSWVDFTVYRFLVGLGVGGMFGAATTLVAESVPAAFRAVALGSLQALSALGQHHRLAGRALRFRLALRRLRGPTAGWRVLFFVGIVPALLDRADHVRAARSRRRGCARRRRRPAGASDTSIGSPVELFRDPRWRQEHRSSVCCSACRE